MNEKENKVLCGINKGGKLLNFNKDGTFQVFNVISDDEIVEIDFENDADKADLICFIVAGRKE